MEDQWEMGLPSIEDLTPLSQSLISPELAMAFGITPDVCRSLLDLNKSSYDTIDPKDDTFDGLNLRLFPGEGSKTRRGDSLVPEETNSGSKEDNGDESGPNRAVKRPRLVWTPNLHKRFVDVIEHLGIEKAVPKTIMEMMNVEGLTRENVASHLQKYRLYLKRMEGLTNEDHSTPRSAAAAANAMFEYEGFGSMPIPVPMPMSLSPQPPSQVQQRGSSLPVMPMTMVGPPPGAYGGYGLPVGNPAPPGYNCGLESAGFGMFWNRQRG